MSLKLKPIKRQTIVVTGATSGIGLCTARLAAKRGANLVLIARNIKALTSLSDELRAEGTPTLSFAADVANEEDLSNAAEESVRKFGSIDTWVNNAGVSIYGRLEAIPHHDSRRLFETNFWGVVNGSIIAAKHLKETGGAIINIGSVLSDRAIPVQGMYSASKFAVKGFTEALRMELEAEGAPISVTLIKPSAINTPYPDHAKNYMGLEPQNPAPVYDPEVVAETILHCAENVVRDVFVGGGGKASSILASHAPRLTDKFMETAMIDAQNTGEPPAHSKEGLHRSGDHSLTERGNYSGHVAKSSLYTKASLRPVSTGAMFVVGLGTAFVLGRALLAPTREAADDGADRFTEKILGSGHDSAA